MRILYDVSRLLSRAERTAPTGVDRVCLAYAEWLASRPDVVMIPVRGRKGRLVTVDPAFTTSGVPRSSCTADPISCFMAVISARKAV